MLCLETSTSGLHSVTTNAAQYSSTTNEGTVNNMHSQKLIAIPIYADKYFFPLLKVTSILQTNL